MDHSNFHCLVRVHLDNLIVYPELLIDSDCWDVLAEDLTVTIFKYSCPLCSRFCSFHASMLQMISAGHACYELCWLVIMDSNRETSVAGSKGVTWQFGSELLV